MTHFPSILLNVKIEIKLKLQVNELDKVKDLIYPSFLWTFSFSNREVKFSNHDSEQSEKARKLSENEISSFCDNFGAFQVIWCPGIKLRM